MTNDTVEIKLEGKEEDYFGTDALVKPRERVVTFGGDSDIPLKPDRSVKDLEVSPIKIIIMLKKAMSIGMSGVFKRHQPSKVIDPGAKQDIIGGVGWKILHLSDQSTHKNKSNKRNCRFKASDKEYKDTDDGLEKGK